LVEFSLANNAASITAVATVLMSLATIGAVVFIRKMNESVNKMYELEKYREKRRHVQRTEVSGTKLMQAMPGHPSVPFIDPKKEKALSELRGIKKKEREIERRKKELESQLGAV